MINLDPPGGRPWALLGICGASLFLNVILCARVVWVGGGVATPALAAVEPAAETEAVAIVEEAAAAEASAPSADVGDLRVLHLSVEGSFAQTLQGAVPEHANVVSQVFARLYFWDLNLRRDLQKGDDLRLAYDWDGQLASIPVASYTSKKHGKTLNAYQFRATGDDFPSWWNDTGTEVPYRLKVGPLDSYDQITSLIKDRPRHHGMDFKAPEGTPVVSPLAARVLRTNWNVYNNGDCVEVEFADGTLARFLHLSAVSVQPGQRIAARTEIGVSGNTGHSTAPHLHYELEKNGKVIDPVDYHGVYRRTLPAEDAARFATEKARLDAILATADTEVADADE